MKELSNSGGSAWESNPPKTLLTPPNGVEVREAHRDSSAPPVCKYISLKNAVAITSLNCLTDHQYHQAQMPPLLPQPLAASDGRPPWLVKYSSRRELLKVLPAAPG